jgi:hypothetical protein
MESIDISEKLHSFADNAELAIGRMAVGGSIGVGVGEALNLISPNPSLNARDIAGMAIASAIVWTTQRFKS